MNKFVIYIISFILGYLLCKMMGDGFSVRDPSASCTTKLIKTCGKAKKKSTQECEACASDNEYDLKAAGCTSNNVVQWCASPTPSPLPSDRFRPETAKDLQDAIDSALKIDPTGGHYASYKGTNISDWDTIKIKDMGRLFLGAIEFNGDISSWDTSNVTNMYEMFKGANKFNGDISSWDTSRVQDMSYMFEDAKNFNQPLDKWNVSNVTSFENMFKGSNLSKSNALILKYWNVKCSDDSTKNPYLTDMFADTPVLENIKSDLSKKGCAWFDKKIAKGFDDCTGVRSTYNDCSKIIFKNEDLWDKNVIRKRHHGNTAVGYYKDDYKWSDYLKNVLGNGHYITDAHGYTYQCDGGLKGYYTEENSTTSLVNGSRCNTPLNNSEYCTGMNIGSVFKEGHCGIGHLKYKKSKLDKLREASNPELSRPDDSGEYARNIYGNAWYEYKLDSNNNPIYKQCGGTPDRKEDYITVGASDYVYTLKPNADTCILRPSKEHSM